jgi:RNA polymerase sigma-70 factor (ECF subfamily)
VITDLDQTDSQLAIQVQEGDREAFSELVDRYQGRIYSFTYHFFRNDDLATDMTQETFLRVFRFIKRYDPKRKFSTWIYSIAKNICIDEKRKINRSKTISLENLPPGAIVGDGDAMHMKNPDQISTRLEDRMLLEESIALLPEKYRAAIILCYFQELSYQEIADVLGISLNLVKVRIFRGKKKLLEIIKSKSDPSDRSSDLPPSELKD